MKRFAFGLILSLWCSLAFAQSNIIGGGEWGDVKVAGGGGVTVTHLGAFNSTPFATSQTGSINIGTAAPNRFIIVTGANQSQIAATSITVNGVSLNADSNATAGAYVFSGLVTSGTGSVSVVVTWTGFTANPAGFDVFQVSGLGSTTVQTATSSSGNVVTANVPGPNGVMFAAAYLVGVTSPTWSTSTIAPNNFYSDSTFGIILAAEWQGLVANASFIVSAQASPAAGSLAVATYK